MLARSVIFALLLVLCLTPPGRATESGGATVVLQLPPSMSPETVKSLIADLAAKGVQPAENSADPPPGSGPALMTSVNLAAQGGEATKQAMRAVPALWQAP